MMKHFNICVHVFCTFFFSRSKSDINSLLKDGPGYSYKDKNRDDTQLQPYGDGTKLQPYSHPDIKRTFTSTSISRIVKPDGVSYKN